MTVQELQQKLIKAYSTENLNRIAVTLINLYREKQFSILKRIAGVLEDHVNITIGDDGKGVYDALSSRQGKPSSR